MNITVSDKDIERIKRKLTNTAGGIGNPQIIGAAMIVGGNTLKRIMAEYPPVSRRKQPFKTDKSRRFFFWAKRKGFINAPYVRGMPPAVHNSKYPGSEDLKSRWMVRKISNGVEVANNASYARLVQGWDKQTTYHKETGWRTDHEVMTTERDRIVSDISAAYCMGVNAVWGK